MLTREAALLTPIGDLAGHWLDLACAGCKGRYRCVEMPVDLLVRRYGPELLLGLGRQNVCPCQRIAAATTLAGRMRSVMGDASA